MILFSDPADVAARGTEPENVYPHTFWLPGTGKIVLFTWKVKSDSCFVAFNCIWDDFDLFSLEYDFFYNLNALNKYLIALIKLL